MQAGTGPETARSAAATLLGGRYKLWERLGEQGGSAEWRATDEVLARPVSVRTFRPGSGRVSEAVAAARMAAQVSDPRLARVMDADENAEPPYIVTEWPSGTRLGELAGAGPVSPWRAAQMIAEAAGALAVAHEAGLGHLCLTPDSLWCDADGQVKITGLGIAAALTGARSADPARADADGLARLLYAALTGYWPGPDYPALPSAPRPGGRLRGPGQVRPGIPARVGAVACRALPGEACAAQPPILSPSQLAMELEAITRPGPDAIPVSGRSAPVPGPKGAPTLPLSLAVTEPCARPAPVPAARSLALFPAVRPPRHLARKLFIVIVVLGLLAAVGWLIADELTRPVPRGVHAALPSTVAGRLVPFSASAFGPAPPPATTWRSSAYWSPMPGSYAPARGCARRATLSP